MVKSIRKLDISVSNKIAAGEVVERPVSVVKELVENSIDAGATQISVEIRDGGIGLIRVTDNGCGMAGEDALLAFERHATSKIYTEEDLGRIVTMGFRGEALSSIAAVARVELITRQKDAEIGIRTYNVGGRIEESVPYAAVEGTTIRVADLFFNTPARKKFLKRASVETAYITDLMGRYILGNPSISFRYTVNGQTVYHSFGNGVLKDCIEVVYGREVLPYLTEINGQNDEVRLFGYIGGEEIARANRSDQTLFVNGRYIKNEEIAQAVRSAADTRFTVGKFPLFVLCMDVSPEQTDVNVHPNKMEVKFADDLHVQDAVYTFVKKALLEGNRTVSPVFIEKTEKEETDFVQLEMSEAKPHTSLAESFRSITVEFDDSSVAQELRESTFLDGYECGVAEATVLTPGFEAAESKLFEERVTVPRREEEPKQPKYDFISDKEYRIVGVIYQTYIILEAGENVYFIDQHAAHERLLYEKFVKSINDNVVSQPMLMPYIFKVSDKEFEFLTQNHELLTQLGFELEPFGAREYRINAVPVVFGSPAVKPFFDELLSSVDRFTYLKSVDLRRNQLMQMACKKAVKGGDKLSDEDIRALLSFIEAEKTPLTCPHGRPIVLAMSRTEIEKKFKRIN